MDGESRSTIKISEPPSRIPPRGPMETSNEMTHDDITNDENSQNLQGPLHHAAINPNFDMSKNNESISIPKPFSGPVPSIHNDVEVSEHNYSNAEPPSRPPPRRPRQDESNAVMKFEQTAIEISENKM